ncbi:MAG: LolA family protein [Anaerolineales bacterium]
MLRKSLICLFAAFAVTGLAQAQTADELVAKNIQAHGGSDKIKSVQSMRMTGKILGGGMEMPMVMEFKRPNSMRMEFTVQGMTGIQAYDGTTGWVVMPFAGKKEPEKISGEDLKAMEDQADIDGPLVDYKEKGHQVEYLGKVDMEGTPAHKLKVTKKNGDVVTVYLDADAFLEIKAEGKSVRRGQEVEFETVYGDYKDVGGGLVLPHSLEIKPKGSPQGQNVVIEKVELNPEIAADRFAMPAPAKDAAQSN